MSRFVCLLALLVLGVVVVPGFADDHCNQEVTPGSEPTLLSSLEDKMKTMKEMKKKAKDIKDMAEKWGIWKKSEKKEEEESSRFGDIMNTMKEMKLIPPGMYWCGDGNTAKHENDLGYFSGTDACCQDHDNCQNNILSGQKLLNLQNQGLFTKSAHACDIKFYQCLKKVVNESKMMSERYISDAIGKTYFNLVRPQCFRCSCPKDTCNKDDGTECKDHCLRYEWIDNPNW